MKVAAELSEESIAGTLKRGIITVNGAPVEIGAFRITGNEDMVIGDDYAEHLVHFFSDRIFTTEIGPPLQVSILVIPRDEAIPASYRLAAKRSCSSIAGKCQRQKIGCLHFAGDVHHRVAEGVVIKSECITVICFLFVAEIA